ncbi:MAG: aminotransferase class IV [Phycisphaerae bacterium]
MATELAYLDGAFVSLPEAKVSIEDRGLQFGDAIYEVIAAYDGRPFLAEQHLARLKRSAAAIDLEIDLDAPPLRPVITEGLRRSGLTDALIYLQITRGVAPRSHEIPEGITPTVIMTFKPLPAISDERRRRGVRVTTLPDTRWAKCHIKATTLLANVLAKSEALRRGYDDAVFVTEEGQVRECTAANIFVVQRSCITTPCRTESVLHGITQSVIFDCTAAIGVDIAEQSIHVDALQHADEVFMSSTAVEVLAITSINDAPVGNGQVGLVTQGIHREFQARTRGSSPIPPQRSSTAANH